MWTNFQVSKNTTVFIYDVQDPYTQTVYTDYEDTPNVGVHSVYPDQQHDHKVYVYLDDHYMTK